VVAAFMSRAELLILDEPTGGLDPLVQRTVLDLVHEAKADGRTVFFSSHILSVVQAVCDRVGIIREGLLVATERVEDLFAQRLNCMTPIFEELPPVDTLDINGVTELERGEKSIVLEVIENLPLVLAAFCSRRRIAAIIAAVIIIASYFGNNLGTTVSSLELLQPLFQFICLDFTGTAVTEGQQTGDMLVLLGIGLLAFALALFFFQRRKLTMGAWPWQRDKVEA
jgi:hypothetical protein